MQVISKNIQKATGLDTSVYDDSDLKNVKQYFGNISTQ